MHVLSKPNWQDTHTGHSETHMCSHIIYTFFYTYEADRNLPRHSLLLSSKPTAGQKRGTRLPLLGYRRKVRTVTEATVQDCVEGVGWTPSPQMARGRQGANKDRTNRRTRHFEHEHEMLSKTECLETQLQKLCLVTDLIDLLIQTFPQPSSETS